MSVALTASRRSNAIRSACGSKSARRVHRARNGEAGSCAWTPPIRSRALTGSSPDAGSSSSWRASVARLSARGRERRVGGSRHVPIVADQPVSRWHEWDFRAPPPYDRGMPQRGRLCHTGPQHVAADSPRPQRGEPGGRQARAGGRAPVLFVFRLALVVVGDGHGLGGRQQRGRDPRDGRPGRALLGSALGHRPGAARGRSDSPLSRACGWLPLRMARKRAAARPKSWIEARRQFGIMRGRRPARTPSSTRSLGSATTGHSRRSSIASWTPSGATAT